MTGYEKVLVKNEGDDPVLLCWREGSEKVAYYLQPGNSLVAPLYAVASLKKNSKLVVYEI